MTKILPFCATIYNPEKIPDLSRVVCPPYDIISGQRQEYYHNLCPHNLIHILLGKDIPGEDKYRRAADYFKDWLKNKILIPDKSPAIYFYSQQYILKGEKKTRLGFIARLYLDEINSNIFGHEHTRLEPKEDRLRLLRATRANLSPIFVIFSDKKRLIQSIYQQYIQGKKPFIDMIDDEKIVQKLWRLDSPDILSNIQAKMSGENIFIADGHHRYEVACAYRDQMKQKTDTPTGQEGFNYILAYFTDTRSRDLTILPIHRLVKLDSVMDIKKFLASITDYFDVEEVKDKIRFFFLMEKAGHTEHVLGMYKDKIFRLLRLKNIKILDRLFSDKTPEFRSLDVSILNYIVLKKILKIDLENKDILTFSPNAKELIQKVDNNALHMAFFLNPVKIEQIISLALRGDKMPAKSTYFYPKVLSGLVINKFNEDKS
jgi:uncharacterized protein (DUF1015 family)